jgi:beta-mannosidase
MFACALYPVTPDFMNSVHAEVVQQVRRLQHHASIAIWAGNNENEAALEGHWWPEILVSKSQYEIDYRLLYADMIRNIVRQEDPYRPFLTSSPSNGVLTEKEGYLSSHPQDNRYGDVHYYNYVDDLWVPDKLPSAKFVSEFGVQCYPSLASWKRVVNESCLSFPISSCIEHRQHQPSGTDRMHQQIGIHFNMPAAGGIESFAKMIYLSQINQAMSIKSSVEFYRRNRNVDPDTGEGMTYGALYWQLNDVWVAPTWSSIEFNGEWKMLHYYSREFFAPIILVPSLENNVFKVHAVSDLLTPIVINVTITAYNTDPDKGSWTGTMRSKLQANSVTEVYQEPLTDLISRSTCTQKDDCILRVRFDSRGVNPRVRQDVGDAIGDYLNGDNFLLISYQQMLKPSFIRVQEVREQESGSAYVYEIKLRCESIAMFVWLSFSDDSIRGSFDRNGFIAFESDQVVHFSSFKRYSPALIGDKISIQTIN